MANVTKSYCPCPHCRIRGLMGPVVLITIGVLFLIGQYTRYDFWETWPIILISVGVVLVAQAFVSREGHVGS